MSIVVTQDAGIATLRIDRVDSANALDPASVTALGDALIAADHDPDVRAIILTATGERHFCSGIDIKAGLAVEAGGAKLAKADPARRGLIEILLELDTPTIAAVNGVAVGLGFELVLACDLAIADTHARFGCPEAKRGMAAHFPSIMLPRRMAPPLALDMLLGGEPIDADEAYRRHLLLAVTPTGGAFAAATARAQAIAANAPLSIRRIKRMVRRSREMPVLAALRLDEHPNPYDSEDRIEGFRAFVEKRPPQWKGR